MAMPSPDTFHPELTNDRLGVIAKALLNVRYEN